MNPRELFDVFVRTLGAVSMVYGLWDITHAVLFNAGYWQNPDMSFHFYFIAGWTSVGIGLILMRFSFAVVNFAYGVEQEKSVENGPAAEDDN